MDEQGDGNFHIWDRGDLGAMATICNSDHKDDKNGSTPGSGCRRHGAGNSAVAATDLATMVVTELGE